MLKFATFTSDIEISFYAALASHKINHDKLDDSARRVVGLYEIRPTDTAATSCRMQLRGNALTSEDVPSNCFRAEGLIKNYNTIEEYRQSDKPAILDRAARTVWEAIKDGTIFSCPSLLGNFTVLCYADLKKYKFTYLFGYPALHSDPPWTVIKPLDADDFAKPDVKDAKHVKLTPIASSALVEAIQTWRYSQDSRQWGFFLAKRIRDQRKPSIQSEDIGIEPDDDTLHTASWSIGSLGQYEQGFFDSTEPADRFVCFSDPSTYEEHPGWPLRNLLSLVRKRWGLTSLQIICYRDVHAHRHAAKSIILNVECEAKSDPRSDQMPKVTGWERSPSGKVVSKIANLVDYMDPSKLADQAVDLNLKLIKWRIAPSLDLDIIKNKRCLLLGAGTLGSYVSRNLMGWGVRKITFVDNGAVSFSNPVRQPLFNFEDCLGGGVKKAQRAAAALAEIYPGVEASGYDISVPMAAHPLINEEQTRSEFEKLQQLFNEHDVIFILMDTRESRWLPTVMGKAMGKLVMNAALGFDSYVVMRHGSKESSENQQRELGCYFCNDVVAPADSMSDRTLDQQCTVTRPGVAAIASAMLVELMVSVLQDESRSTHAPASASGATAEAKPDHPLGLVPHTLRGFLNNWSTLNLTGQSYSQCSACSTAVLDAFDQQGWEFVKRAMNDKDYVSELSGLAELQRQAEQLERDIEWDDDDQDQTAMEDEGELL